MGAGGIGLFRYPIQATFGTGMLTFTGPAGYSCSNFTNPGCIEAGETWYFQGWYRDGASSCSIPFNLSNGLAVMFTL